MTQLCPYCAAKGENMPLCILCDGTGMTDFDPPFTEEHYEWWRQKVAKAQADAM